MKMRRAFTLVEILVVIAVISILAALVTVAVAGAMRAAKRAAIGTEMSQIAMALDLYKAEFGEYPPDMFDDEALVRHVRKRWPRLDWTSVDTLVLTPKPGSWGGMSLTQQRAWLIREAISIAYTNAYGSPVDFRGTNPFTPLGALALWLGGFPNADGKLSGFGADPTNPFDLTHRCDVVFLDWEVGNGKNIRIVNFGTGSVPVIGNEIQSVFVPIVYFRGRSDGGPSAYRLDATGTGPVKQIDVPGCGWCVPYADMLNSDSTIRWKNPTTYQLIHPGLDGTFGDAAWDETSAPPTGRRIITLGIGIGPWDVDNITNISDHKELRSILP
jgi:prepilin-type N-terminal cleavage/methylation domain-containing protein